MSNLEMLLWAAYVVVTLVYQVLLFKDLSNWLTPMSKLTVIPWIVFGFFSLAGFIPVINIILLYIVYRSKKTR